MFVAQEEMIRAMAMEQKRKKQMKENSYIHRPEISTMNLVAWKKNINMNIVA